MLVPEDIVVRGLTCPESYIVATKIEIKLEWVNDCCVHNCARRHIASGTPIPLVLQK